MAHGVDDCDVSSPSDERLRAYLSRLSKEQLVARLVALAERDEVALTALHAEQAATSGEFDLAAFRKELTARIRISGFVDWRGAAAYAQRVHGLLDVLEALTATGRAAEVVVLAEHVMARLDTALGRIDDSSGHMGGVLDRVSDLHLAACVAARPEPKRLAVRLVEFALKSDWEWFLDAPQRYGNVLGEEGLAAYRARLDREWEALPALPPAEPRMLAFHDRRRFTVTRLRESLARAGGNFDELVAVLAKDLSSPYRFCVIADELEQAGREREALVWLERGLRSFPPAADERLRSQLIRAYVRDGQVEDAVALAERAFAAEPRASTYRELRETASGLPDWRERRSAALQLLRDPAADGGRSVATSTWTGPRSCGPKSRRARSRRPGPMQSKEAASHGSGGNSRTRDVSGTRTNRSASTAACSTRSWSRPTCAPTRRVSRCSARSRRRSQPTSGRRSSWTTSSGSARRTAAARSC